MGEGAAIVHIVQMTLWEHVRMTDFEKSGMRAVGGLVYFSGVALVKAWQ
jgi:hypothetical protein